MTTGRKSMRSSCSHVLMVEDYFQFVTCTPVKYLSWHRDRPQILPRPSIAYDCRAVQCDMFIARRYIWPQHGWSYWDRAPCVRLQDNAYLAFHNILKAKINTTATWRDMLPSLWLLKHIELPKNVILVRMRELWKFVTSFTLILSTDDEIANLSCPRQRNEYLTDRRSVCPTLWSKSIFIVHFDSTCWMTILVCSTTFWSILQAQSRRIAQQDEESRGTSWTTLGGTSRLSVEHDSRKLMRLPHIQPCTLMFCHFSCRLVQAWSAA